MSQYNRLLIRQIQRFFGEENEIPKEMENLLEAISKAYDHFEKDRLLLERAMDLSSGELLQANNKLKTQAKELSVSNDELKQLAYVAAHDLGEPLKTIRGVVQLLTNEEKDNISKDGTTYIRKILEEVSLMRDLLDDLEDYSLLNSNGGLDQTEIDVNELLKEVSENLFLPISQTNALISYENLPRITGDKNQITQLFQNILDNSLKFKSEDPPFIKISSGEWSQREFLFSITDNGIGIPHEYREKAFQLFKRIHKNGNYEGTGIGLAICKKIVRAHGGKIWFNDKLEHGLEVSFTLPKE